MTFLLGLPIFKGYVKFPGCNFEIHGKYQDTYQHQICKEDSPQEYWEVHSTPPKTCLKRKIIFHPPPFLGFMLVFGGVPLWGCPNSWCHLICRNIHSVMLSTQDPWPVMMWTMVKRKTYTFFQSLPRDSSSLSWEGNKTETINHIKSPYLWWQDQHALKFQFLRFCHTMLRGVVNTLECCNCLTYCGFGRAVAT